jgi:hypothetical protein
MPPTTENIPDKPGFDVYAMMLIVSAVFLGVSIYLLNDYLTTVYDFWNENPAKRAQHLTLLNDDPVNKPDIAKIGKQDLEEWGFAYKALTGKTGDFPVTGFEWPDGYDPLEHPVMENQDNLKAIPAEALKALMAGADAAAPSTPTPTPATPATGTPATGTPPAPTEPPK